MDAGIASPPPPTTATVTRAAMVTSTATTSTRSVLDKPLHELTEDDFSLVRREDCRRYLQEKGMRRPSWNKSQAIQQVISLKSLLEPPPPPSLPVKCPAPTLETQHPVSVDAEKSNSCGSMKELSTGEPEVSVSATEPVRGQECKKPAVDDKAITPRSLESTDLPHAEMTIFYSGKVNVYEEVPADRAQTILHIAASPFQFSRDEQSSLSSPRWSTHMQLHPSNTKSSVIHPHRNLSLPVLTGKVADCVPQVRQEEIAFRESDVDGQSNRQVSLQKYREKKKDRGRFKSIDRAGPPGLDVYLNRHVTTNIINGQSSGSNANSPRQPGHPYPLLDSMESSKHPRLSVDINDKV